TGTLDITSEPEKTIQFRPNWYRIAIWGAAAVVILSLGLWWTIGTVEKEEQVEIVTQDVMPGRNRAMLTLANGQQIDLDESNDGIAVTGDHIHYIDGGQTVLSDNLPVGLNTLTTPNGGQYRVDLPDGTKVWLNSA